MPGQSGGAPAMNALTIRFEGVPIRLGPRIDAQITVRVEPPGAYAVRFSLLDAAAGAVLNRDQVVSGPDGRASVILTTPNSPTHFVLRAQVDSFVATTAISIEGGALTTLNVLPEYSGKRAVSTWTANAYPNTTCGAFQGQPSDGPYLVSAPKGSALRLADVPAIAPLAVVARAGGVAQGCTTVDNPTPNGETTVGITATDVPLNLGATVLDVVFGASADDATLKAELQAGASLVQASMRGPDDNEAAALLDAMAAKLEGAELAQFTLARQDAGWDQSLAAALGRNGGTRIADALARWLRDGQRELLSSHAIQGRISATPMSSDVPHLVVQRIGGASAASVGVSAVGAKWSVDPNDTLAISASLSWPAASLACAVLSGAASAETGSSELGVALSRALSCSAVGSHLTTSNAEAALTWSTACDAECNAELCQSALTSSITQACAASKKELSTLAVLATGSAEVGSAAQATSFEGSWVGRLTRGTQKSSTSGALLGSAPRGL
ncbi:MAG TPA: hypothetical protein VFQ35_12190 [Polyangiaceae bacterium]|nr:hypothetical protein [Polyangiaceae bacterium]